MSLFSWYTMKEFRTKINENGRISIPISCRKILNLRAGDELILHVENDELHIMTVKRALQKAQLIVQRHAQKRSLVGELRDLREEDK
jgi:AbrB family looped-hinge helix DNA binding protein